MLIRPATESDVPAIRAIYNQIAATSTAIYNDQPVTLEDRLTWFRSRMKSGYPVLVAIVPSANATEDSADATQEEIAGDQIAGFASFGDFRSWPGYRFSVEHTVHLDAAHRGRGIGKQLLLALIPIAQLLGKHAMVGAVDAENPISIRLHESLGFERVAHFRQIGHKFNRWLDLLFFEKIL
jgi:phosphinothricin acetyltransferase